MLPIMYAIAFYPYISVTHNYLIDLMAHFALGQRCSVADPFVFV